MTKIQYIKGDCLDVPPNKNIIIPHVCNCDGGWGAGFVLAISKKWKQPEQLYRKWYKDCKGRSLPLGTTQTTTVQPNIAVVNMIAQTLGCRDGYDIPLRYDALETCIRNIGKDILGYTDKWEIRAPKFGSALAGGDWNTIESMIVKYWCKKDIPVTICSL